MPDIKPDRTNWKLFCKEPRLTDEEYKEWLEMSRTIVKNDSLLDFIVATTGVEWEALMAKPANSWENLINHTDANRRLARAEIKTWKAWNSIQNGC